MDELERLVPKEWRKIAQDDNVSGEPIAAVYFNPGNKSFFVQAMQLQANGQFTSMTFGPVPDYAMMALIHIFADIESMDRKYRNLD
jgi:hypothetical protein